MKHTKKYAAIFCSVLLILMIASFTVVAESRPVDLNQNQYTAYSLWTNTISHQSKFSGVNSSSSNHYVYFTAQYYDAVAKQGFDDNYYYAPNNGINFRTQYTTKRTGVYQWRLKLNPTGPFAGCTASGTITTI